MAYGLFNAFNARPDTEAYFIAATSRFTHKPHTGTAFQSFPDAEREWLFWGDDFDYFLQSQRQLPLLHQDMAELLAQLKPDIVHVHHTLRIGMEILPFIKRILPNTRLVYTLHDFIPICYRDGQMVKKTDESLCESSSAEACHGCFPEVTPSRFALRKRFIQTHFDAVDHFISPSYFLAERYVNWGIDGKRISVIENGWPEKTAAPHRILKAKEPRNRFAFFGQITPYKGVHILLDAAELLLARDFTDFQLDIYGNASLQIDTFQDAFRKRIDSLPNEYIRWHGRYEPDAMPSLMAACDWVVCPSTWWENSPLVIGEAFQHQRPVICSDIGGMAEKVMDGKNGLHFPCNNAEALADILHKAATSTNLWNLLVNGITAPPTMELCAETHLSLYGTT